uniref:Uncharacterized protein n=1 Tax=Romanomermis culicivorax TaxID=13658 RepID=A0A915L7H1_ROMCU
MNERRNIYKEKYKTRPEFMQCSHFLIQKQRIRIFFRPKVRGMMTTIWQAAKSSLASKSNRLPHEATAEPTCKRENFLSTSGC